MVSLFTDEANQILRHPLHLLGGRNEDRNVAMVSEHDVSPPGHVTNTGESSLGHVTSIRESAVDHVTPPTTHERYCQSCHAPLATRADQVIHYQLDWHRYNLKRRLRGNPPVTQEEFEQIAGEGECNCSIPGPLKSGHLNTFCCPIILCHFLRVVLCLCR